MSFSIFQFLRLLLQYYHANNLEIYVLLGILVLHHPFAKQTAEECVGNPASNKKHSQLRWCFLLESFILSQLGWDHNYQNSYRLSKIVLLLARE